MPKFLASLRVVTSQPPLDVGRARVERDGSRGGEKGGGKSNRALAEMWQGNATPVYEELRAANPNDGCRALAWKIQADPRCHVPGAGRVER